MVIATGAAGGAYAATKRSEYTAICSFQAYVRTSAEVPQSPDTEKFINTLAAQQVTVAAASGLYGKVAERHNVNSTSFASNVLTLPGPGLGVFHVRVRDSQQVRAIRLANSVCDSFIVTIKQQRADEISAALKTLQDRVTAIQSELRRLEAIPAQRRTASDTALLQGHREALRFNSFLIGTTISLPPDNIAVLTRATSAERRDPKRLATNLIIGVLGGLLACFLYILIGEVASERRRAESEEIPPDLSAMREPQPTRRR